MGTPTPTRHSRAADLALVAGSFVASCLAILLLEVGLRATGIGEPDAARASRLRYQQISLPILRPATRPDGTRGLRTVDPRLPYQWIALEKPRDALRVFAFGGSATAGLGYSPNATFTHQLERMLAQAYPDRQVEVVNLGIVALSSQQVKLLVADVCRSYEPDLLVVYSGNNEFLEIHAEKYAQANARWYSSIQQRLVDTNVYRIADRWIRGPRDARASASGELSTADLRRTQAEIIQDVELDEREIAGVVDRYEANIDEMASLATAHGVPILLTTVASNWKWRGRNDLPDEWLDELLGSPGPESPERLRRAIALLDQRIDGAPASERWEWRYRRAKAHEALGETRAARSDYRAAMNEDPHLRRALDEMAERVRDVGRRRGVPVLDSIASLSRDARNGIIGFDEFYDYVHFTPTGALRMAGYLFDSIQPLGLAQPTNGFDATAYRRREVRRLEQLETDPLGVDEWIGFGFDAGMLRDRDLWKYERMLEELDRRIDANPNDFRALGYRGNARFFQSDGAAEAARDYRAALAVAGDQPVIRANLEQLLAARP